MVFIFILRRYDVSAGRLQSFINALMISLKIMQCVKLCIVRLCYHLQKNLFNRLNSLFQIIILFK